MISSSQLNKNLLFIQSRIQKAAQQSGRKADEITLIAVTKTLSFEAWNKILKLKLTTIGESKIQETENKTKEFNYRKQIELHLIGHLQSNKTKKAVKHFDIIQTVDSIKLMERINKASEKENKHQKIFLQINTEKDSNKFGFTKKNVFIAAEQIEKFKNIALEGIMTIPPPQISEQKLKKIYENTRKIRDKIRETIQGKCRHLSMGMSNDFEIAIKEGATHVRIGTALFGERAK